MKKHFVAAALAALLFSSAAQAAPGDLAFTVVRKGDDIGTHTIHFDRKGDETTVTIRTRIAVKIAFITAYKFTCDATEVWKGGRLVKLDSLSNDNGTKHVVAVAEKDGKLALTADGKSSPVSSGIIPTSWWNMKTVEQKEMLDYLTGKVDAVTVKKAGAETVSAGGKDVKAEHYSLTGDNGLNRELWYAADGTLLRQSLTKKGDLIEYVEK